MTFIETGVEPDDRFEQQTKDLAATRGWVFEKLIGNLTLLQRLVDGPWDEIDFLIVKSGESIQFDYTGNIVRID